MERSRIVSNPRSPGRPRSEEAHDAILTAAVELIREVGYDAVTMEGIAAKAGVGKATVYRRWKDKETLVIEAIGRIVAAFPVPDTGTLRGDLHALLRILLGMYRDPATGALLSGLVAAIARSERLAAAIRGGFVGTWLETVRAVLERAATRGDLRDGGDLGFASALLSAPFFYRFLLTGEPVDEPLAGRVVDAVMRAIAQEAGG
jgi:AcrR family transcriptional regulator